MNYLIHLSLTHLVNCICVCLLAACYLQDAKISRNHTFKFKCLRNTVLIPFHGGLSDLHNRFHLFIFFAVWYSVLLHDKTFPIIVFRRVLQQGREDLWTAPCWKNKAAARRWSHSSSRVCTFSWFDRFHPASHRSCFGEELLCYSGESGTFSCTYTYTFLKLKCLFTG